VPRSNRKASTVVVARSADPIVALRHALDVLGRPAAHEGAPVACLVVGLGSATWVSPAVLAETIQWLAEQGIAEPIVLASVRASDRDAGWDVAALSARHGYSPGSLLDAWLEVEPATVGAAHVIDGRPIARAWQRADLRVVIAPCATDAIDGHCLVLDVLRHLPPTIAGAIPADVVADLLLTMPPDISILDATVTSDGPAGTSVRRAVRTDTIVASTSAVLVDVIGAALLGADPMRSPLLSGVVPVTGLPADYHVVGDLTAFPGIDYPPEPLLRTTRAAAGNPSLGRVLSAAMVDEGRATSEDDVVMSALRQQLRPWVSAAPDSPTAAASLAWTHAGAAAVVGYVDAFRTTFAKDSVPRRVASLGLDLGDYSARDYEAAESSLRPLLQLVNGLRVDRDGLRWTHLDGAVVFEASRIVAAPYGPWIERVDVSRAISMMADYLGGCVVAVAHDKEGRIVRQAERNIYLPQPNYVSFSGGQVIDVCKLSVVRHRADSTAIWWRTVRSPNESAVHDDGTVEFSDAGDGRTRVVIRGRQQFTLPPFWQAFDLDLTPELRDSLTQDAYRQFFSTTLDNFEACYEGRDFAIGRDPVDELSTVGLSRLAQVAGGSVKEWLASTAGGSMPDRVRVESIDDNGFTHIAGSRS
jgi:hypothetical protein